MSSTLPVIRLNGPHRMNEPSSRMKDMMAVLVQYVLPPIMHHSPD
jgi:hypothetical protein